MKADEYLKNRLISLLSKFDTYWNCLRFMISGIEIYYQELKFKINEMLSNKLILTLIII